MNLDDILYDLENDSYKDEIMHVLDIRTDQLESQIRELIEAGKQLRLDIGKCYALMALGFEEQPVLDNLHRQLFHITNKIRELGDCLSSIEQIKQQYDQE